MMYFILSSILLQTLLKFLTSSISQTNSPSKETLSPFECGFDSMMKSRIPFSTQFFLLAVMFLIFDIEIALIITLPLLLNLKPHLYSFIPATTFLMLLIIGLFHEWNENSLSWKNYKP